MWGSNVLRKGWWFHLYSSTLFHLKNSVIGGWGCTSCANLSFINIILFLQWKNKQTGSSKCWECPSRLSKHIRIFWELLWTFLILFLVYCSNFFFLNNEIRIYSPINLQLRLMKNHDIWYEIVLLLRNLVRI